MTAVTKAFSLKFRLLSIRFASNRLFENHMSARMEFLTWSAYSLLLTVALSPHRTANDCLRETCTKPAWEWVRNTFCITIQAIPCIQWTSKISSHGSPVTKYASPDVGWKRN